MSGYGEFEQQILDELDYLKDREKVLNKREALHQKLKQEPKVLAEFRRRNPRGSDSAFDEFCKEVVDIVFPLK